MSESTGNKTIFVVCFVAVVAVTGAAVWLNKPLYEQNRQLELQRDELARQVDARRREIQDLNDKSLRFESDPEFVEREARKNHRILPGEVEFKFDAPD